MCGLCTIGWINLGWWFVWICMDLRIFIVSADLVNLKGYHCSSVLRNWNWRSQSSSQRFVAMVVKFWGTSDHWIGAWRSCSVFTTASFRFWRRCPSQNWRFFLMQIHLEPSRQHLTQTVVEEYLSQTALCDLLQGLVRLRAHCIETMRTPHLVLIAFLMRLWCLLATQSFICCPFWRALSRVIYMRLRSRRYAPIWAGLIAVSYTHLTLPTSDLV